VRYTAELNGERFTLIVASGLKRLVHKGEAVFVQKGGSFFRIAGITEGGELLLSRVRIPSGSSATILQLRLTLS
jgi:hypothetical protein